jgi:hypothetical protein
MELITKALRAMIPDPPVRVFLVNAGRALDAAEVIGRSSDRSTPRSAVRALLTRALIDVLLRSTVLPQVLAVHEPSVVGCRTWSQPPCAKPIMLAHTPGVTDRHRLVYDAPMEKHLCDQDRAGACHVPGEGAKELQLTSPNTLDHSATGRLRASVASNAYLSPLRMIETPNKWRIPIVATGRMS